MIGLSTFHNLIVRYIYGLYSNLIFYEYYKMTVPASLNPFNTMLTYIYTCVFLCPP